MWVMHRTHGNANKIPEYSVWKKMRHRCLTPSHQFYARYGGRGISICESWSKFENFYRDMGPRPTEKHTLDRINNDGNYEPNNCRWATRATQSANRSNNVFLTHDGQSHSLQEWSRLLNISQGTLWSRLKNGWSVEKTLGQKVDSSKRNAMAKSNTWV